MCSLSGLVDNWTDNEYGHWLRRPINEHHGSISPTFYKQLLLAQIPKAQKKTVKFSSFIALLGSACVKAACRKLVKLTPGVCHGIRLTKQDDYFLIISLYYVNYSVKVNSNVPSSVLSSVPSCISKYTFCFLLEDDRNKRLRSLANLVQK